MGSNKLNAIVTSENGTKLIPKYFEIREVLIRKKYSIILSTILIWYLYNLYTSYIYIYILEDKRALFGLHSDRMLRKFVWNLQNDPLNYKDCVRNMLTSWKMKFTNQDTNKLRYKYELYNQPLKRSFDLNLISTNLKESKFYFMLFISLFLLYTQQSDPMVLNLNFE